MSEPRITRTRRFQPWSFSSVDIGNVRWSCPHKDCTSDVHRAVDYFCCAGAYGLERDFLSEQLVFGRQSSWPSCLIAEETRKSLLSYAMLMRILWALRTPRGAYLTNSFEASRNPRSLELQGDESVEHWEFKWTVKEAVKGNMAGLSSNSWYTMQYT